MATSTNKLLSPNRQTSNATLHDTYKHTHIDELDSFANVTKVTQKNIEALFDLEPKESDDASHTDSVQDSITMPAHTHTHTQNGKHGSHPSMGGEGNSLKNR